MRYKPTQSSGFTLIEILLVISIVALVMGVSVPASYQMYQSYKNSLKAEEVLAYVSTIRRESFLFGEETVLASTDGRIQQGDGRMTNFTDVFVQIDTPIKFYKNGTTSGGILKIHAGGSVYLLKVSSPFGNLLLERDT